MRDYKIGRADGTLKLPPSSNAVGMADFITPTLVGGKTGTTL